MFRVAKYAEKIIFAAFSMFVLFAAGLLVFFAVYDYNTYNSNDDNAVQILSLSEGWTDSEKKAVSLATYAQDTGTAVGRIVSLYNTLPQITHDTTLAIKAVNARVRVYVSDVLVGEYGYNLASVFGTAPGSKWIYVTAYREYSGSEIRLELSPSSDMTGSMIQGVILGDRYTIVTHNQVTGIVSVILCMVMIFLGMMLFLFHIPMKMILKGNNSILLCSIFSIMVAVWVFSDTDAVAVLFYTPAWVNTAASILLKLIPIPLLFYVRDRFHDTGSVVIRTIISACLLDFSISTFLHFFGVMDYRSSMLGTDILLILTYMAIVVYFILSVIRRNVTGAYAWIFAIGTLSLGVGGFMDLAWVRFGVFTNHLIIHTAVFLFVLSTAILSVKELTETLRLGLKAELIGKLVYKDGLTEISNTMAFKEKLEGLESTKENYEYIGILQFDINNLKTVNDTMGHDMGDTLIKHSAELIQKAFGDIGEAYRTGGDEFTVIVTEEHTPVRCSDAMLNFEKLVLEYNANKNRKFEIQIAYGIAFYKNGSDVFLREILNLADSRMYKKKKQMKEHDSPPSTR